MSSKTKLLLLRISLILTGIIFIGGLPIFLFYMKDPGWTWMPSQPEYEQMIYGVYATLGIFLIIAAFNPLENRSLIWFTVWSSVVHATIMLVQAFNDPAEHHNLWGDIPALYLVAILLAVLMPRKNDPELRG